MATQDLNRWLDTALDDYTKVEVPLGLELRTIVRLRESQRAPQRAWMLALAAACVVVAGIGLALLWPPAPLGAPPLVTAQIAVPRIEKAKAAVATPWVRSGHRDPTRGVPIVVAPLTPEEQALIRLMRNAGAQKLAYSGTLRHAGLDRPAEPLHIENLTIPPLQEEKEP